MNTQTCDPLSVEELSNAYCLAIANSYRLVEDGERLAKEKRFLGAVACFVAGIDEIVASHLLMRAVTLKPESEAWRWFWDLFTNREKKIDFLINDVHPTLFRDSKYTDHFKEVLPYLKDDFVSLQFDSKKKKFFPPGQALSDSGKDKDLSKKIYEYALSLYKALNIHGLPSPYSQFQIFSYLNRTGQMPD